MNPQNRQKVVYPYQNKKNGWDKQKPKTDMHNTALPYDSSVMNKMILSVKIIHKTIIVFFIYKVNGGRDGIRTHGAVAHTHAFQACSLNHSDTLP